MDKIAHKGGDLLMTWDDILKIVLGVIAGCGGISGVIILAVRFSANIIAKRLEEKYTLKLNKELEEYKSKLDNKNYISKTKFDVEFSIYRELSKVFFDMVKDVSIMIPIGTATYPADKKERDEYEHQLYVNAQKSTVVAQDKLNGETPFIPEPLWIMYDEILILCKLQLHTFERRWNVLVLDSAEGKKTFSHEDYARSNEINEKFKALNNEVRTYLSTLDIIE